METYGIGIDKFLATDAGIVYLDIRDRILPYLRTQLENAERAGVNIKGKVKALDRVRTRLDDVRIALSEVLRACEGDIGGIPFREAVLGRSDAGPCADEVNAACNAFGEWARNANAGMEGLCTVLDRACSENEEGRKCMEEFYGVFRCAMDFWSTAMDVYICDYVFENVEMKFKKKVCKDIIKFMPDALALGEAFLELHNREKFDFGQNTEYILARAEEVVDAADNRLQVYRKVRNYAEKFGMPAAFDEWRRGLEVSKQFAERQSSSGGGAGNLVEYQQRKEL